MLVSSLVHAFFVPGSSIFEPCLCHFRASFVPHSSLVCAIYKPGLFHFRAWFVPFSNLVHAIFHPAFYPFRARFVPFSSIAHASLQCSHLISFAKEITTGYMISYYILLFFKHCERFKEVFWAKPLQKWRLCCIPFLNAQSELTMANYISN